MITGANDISKWSQEQPGNVYVYEGDASDRITELDTSFAFERQNQGTDITIEDSTYLKRGLDIRVEIHNRFQQIHTVKVSCT